MSIGNERTTIFDDNPLIYNGISMMIGNMETPSGWKNSVRAALSKAQKDGHGIVPLAKRMRCSKQSLYQFVSSGKLGSDYVRWLEDFLIARHYMERPQFPEALEYHEESFEADDLPVLDFNASDPCHEVAGIAMELARIMLSSSIDNGAKKKKAADKIKAIQSIIGSRI